MHMSLYEGDEECNHIKIYDETNLYMDVFKWTCGKCKYEVVEDIDKSACLYKAEQLKERTDEV